MDERPRRKAIRSSSNCRPRLSAAECGTPLTFKADVDRRRVNGVTIGSLDEPELRSNQLRQIGTIESCLSPGFGALPGLPSEHDVPKLICLRIISTNSKSRAAIPTTN